MMAIEPNSDTPINIVTPIIVMCANCAFWGPLDDRQNKFQIGFCRIRAPQSHSKIDSWPKTTEKAWCKEWSTK